MYLAQLSTYGRVKIKFMSTQLHLKLQALHTAPPHNSEVTGMFIKTTCSLQGGFDRRNVHSEQNFTKRKLTP